MLSTGNKNSGLTSGTWTTRTLDSTRKSSGRPCKTYLGRKACASAATRRCASSPETTGRSMNVQKIFVYGASGHGKVVGDILLASKNPAFVGFIDDRAELRDTRVLGLPVFGDGHWLQEQVRVGRVGVALGVGDNSVRQKLAENCISWGAELGTLVHPTASISKSARLGPGPVLMAQAAITAIQTTA